MNETESKDLRSLLTTFNARALGEGDEITGINLLAAMVITLANLARPASGFRTPDMRLIKVGCNLLAGDSLLSDMIRDEVLGPVERFQNNMLAHVDRLLKSDEEQNQRSLKSLPREWNILKNGSPSEGEAKFLHLMTLTSRDNPAPEGVDGAWLSVVDIPPRPNFFDMIRKPRIFIAASSPRMLENQLGGIQAEQALITIALNRASDAERFGDLCLALMNGTMPLGPSGETVRGRLLVTNPGNVLAEAARQAGDQTTWLGRLVWLVSGNGGPEPPPQQPTGENVVQLPHVAARFEYAAQELFANRMNSESLLPITEEKDLAQHQIRWMAFLDGMEKTLPGISGTARQLLASLVFGFRRILGADEPPKGFKYHMEGIEALARYLILRMTSARAAILFSADDAKKLRLKQKILIKLSEGSLEPRAIYHPLHIPAATCMALLTELETENCVTSRGGKWELVIGATLHGNQHLQLPLEV